MTDRYKEKNCKFCNKTHKKRGLYCCQGCANSDREVSDKVRDNMRSVGENYWQNKRCSSVFKKSDGTCYDIDGKVFWEWYRDENGEAVKTYYSGSGCSTPVIFPYTPPNKPIYEYRHSDAEPRTPAQDENGFLV